MIKLSLCMIVKDEESVLARCLSSVTGRTEAAVSDGTACLPEDNPIDEIVIIDTGSSDRTKEIAAKFGAKIYDFPWQDDFSAARNFSFSKATGDYILWLDADDFIPASSKKRLLYLKQRLEKFAPSAVFCRYEMLAYPYDAKYQADSTNSHSATKSSSIVATAFYRTRIVKNNPLAVWKGRVHEYLPRLQGAITEDENGFVVQHLGSEKPRGTRNLDIYRTQILAKEPLSARDLFYYGRELYYHEFFTEADAIEEKFVRRTDGWHINKIEARKIQAACKVKNGDTVGALNALFDSFLYGTPRAGTLCEIARIFLSNNDYSSAYFWYLCAYHTTDHSAEGDFENIEDRTTTPLIQLVYCAYYSGNASLARHWHEKCMQVIPSHPAVKYNENFFKTCERQNF